MAQFTHITIFWQSKTMLQPSTSVHHLELLLPDQLQGNQTSELGTSCVSAGLGRALVRLESISPPLRSRRFAVTIPFSQTLPAFMISIISILSMYVSSFSFPFIVCVLSICNPNRHHSVMRRVTRFKQTQNLCAVPASKQCLIQVSKMLGALTVIYFKSACSGHKIAVVGGSRGSFG